MRRQDQLEHLHRRWVAPDGLDRSRPREVTLTSGGFALMILSAALLVGGGVAGLLLAEKATREAEEKRILVEQGMTVSAAVKDLGRRRSENDRYWVIYQFSEQGRVHGRRVNVSERTWKSLAIGRSLPVRYLPSNPAINHPVGVRQRVTPLWIAPLIGLGALFAAAACIHVIRIQRTTLSEGRAAPALVTGHEKSKEGTKYSYEFLLLSGAIGTGKGGPSKKPPAVGTTICVLYDSELPRRNSVYPLSLVKIAR